MAGKLLQSYPKTCSCPSSANHPIRYVLTFTGVACCGARASHLSCALGVVVSFIAAGRVELWTPWDDGGAPGTGIVPAATPPLNGRPAQPLGAPDPSISSSAAVETLVGEVPVTSTLPSERRSVSPTASSAESPEAVAEPSRSNTYNEMSVYIPVSCYCACVPST